MKERSLKLILCTRSHEANKVLVSVRDSGPGLGKQNLEEIFNAFYTTKPQGMRMGLAISCSIIEDHGGRLWVEPNDGLGASFQFTLLQYQEVSQNA